MPDDLKGWTDIVVNVGLATIIAALFVKGAWQYFTKVVMPSATRKAEHQDRMNEAELKATKDRNAAEMRAMEQERLSAETTRMAIFELTSTCAVISKNLQAISNRQQTILAELQRLAIESVGDL